MPAARRSGRGCTGRAGRRSWASTLPHRPPTSNNHLPPLEKALAFTHGLLCEARKLTHVAYFRRDPLVPELLGIRRVASQSGLSRFFAGFASAGANLRCFRPLWRWCLERLPSRREGYTLDLDSTRLLHEDGHQEGVHTGYTRRASNRACIPCSRCWARRGWWCNCGCAPAMRRAATTSSAFFLDLWHQLPAAHAAARRARRQRFLPA